MSPQKYNLESLAQRLDPIINTAGVATAVGGENYQFVSNSENLFGREVDASAAVNFIKESPAELYDLERHIRKYEHVSQDIQRRVEAGTLEGTFVEGVYVPEGKRIRDFDATFLYQISALIFSSPFLALSYAAGKILEKKQSPLAHKIARNIEHALYPFAFIAAIPGYAVALPVSWAMNTLVNPLKAGSSVRAYEKLMKCQQKIVDLIPHNILYKSVYEELGRYKEGEEMEKEESLG